MMKNKSTLAKLLAEEDIFVVHKKMDTAYFNAKSRELGLPIWKDEEMTKDIYDLMVCHEIAHALWTPLDMLEKAQVRKINHSFVNIVEDARIERMVQDRYPGSVAVFNRGYRDLTAKDFFGIDDKDVSELNLIDRINLFFKKQKVEFTAEEKVWVKRVAETKTPEDVLNLSEELYAWMAENAPEEESDDEKMIDGSGMSDPNGESGEGEGETGEGETPAGDDGKEETGEGNPSAGDDKGEENGNDVPAGGAGDDGNDDVDGDAKAEEGKSSEVGGVESTGRGGPPMAETDTDTNNAIDKLVDKNATERTYGRIPALNEDLIMPFGEILEKSRPSYAVGGSWVDAKKSEIAAMKDESKKTVGYMVKEFEMKKAADQYARAAVSKTGSLDMGRLHTYKYNEDIFKKVTTLPGATNHGMVMVVDWSGSMYENLKGTLSQLFNLIWFCRRTQIPFEVFAFSDSRGLFIGPMTGEWPNRYEMKMADFKAGDLALHSFKLLEFFSSKMSAKEEIEMMEILWMVASYYGFEADREIMYDKVVFPGFLNLGGTPLNDAIIAMMEIVPKFKRDTGVQKVNTIFLTDGASNNLDGVYDYRLDTGTGEHTAVIDRIRGTMTISDPKTLKNYEVDGYDITDGLLRILKDRVDGMNLIGFFVAGSGRSGRVDKRALYSLQRELSMDAIMEQVKFINKNKYLVIESKGYDEMYVLPAKGMEVSNEGLSDELVGASKAKLKSAFGKSMKGKVESRQLLNKFVKLVA
jgi:hypothetical protein